MITLPPTYQNALKKIRFIDLFAGIGGFRYAMEYFGANCVFSSEWDNFAQECYETNFGEKPEGDITKINEKDIPEHDFICAGFPCQAFSISGHRKGFEDTRGTLFFDVARIANYHQPKILLLENVKNLVKHDNGNTLKTILNTLKEINYIPFYKVINSSLFGVPQRRERIYFVAFHKKLKINSYNFPKGFDIHITLEDIIDTNVPKELFINRDDIHIYKNPIIEKDSMNHYPQRPLQIGKINNGGQGERIYSSFGHAVTQAATTGGPGGSTGLYCISGKIRKLTPKESSRVQGFPEEFKPHERNTQAWKQIGNSVAVNVLQGIIKSIVDMEIINL